MDLPPLKEQTHGCPLNQPKKGYQASSLELSLAGHFLSPHPAGVARCPLCGAVCPRTQRGHCERRELAGFPAGFPEQTRKAMCVFEHFSLNKSTGETAVWWEALIFIQNVTALKVATTSVVFWMVPFILQLGPWSVLKG